MVYPFVSVIMACRNEAEQVERAIGSLLRTDYPRDKLEIIVIDGQSQDGTREILEKLAFQNPLIKILANPKKITPVALNIGIKNSKGEVIIRADAHSEYAPDYITKSVTHLNSSGAWCVGGPIDTKPSRDSLVAKIIAAILSSPFGVGFSHFRISKISKYVDTVPFGAFKREIFNKIGLYDERLARNEDNEFCSRITKEGGKIFMTPEIKSTYYARPTLTGFLKHGYNSGAWNAFTQKLYPYTFKWRHFLPLLFFLGSLSVFIAVVFGLISGKSLAFLLFLLLPYFIVSITSSFFIARKEKLGFLSIPLIVWVYFSFHFIYGYGTFKGWIRVLLNIRKQS